MRGKSSEGRVDGSVSVLAVDSMCHCSYRATLGVPSAVISLHVGLHKTASSSIQLALLQLRHRTDTKIFTPGSRGEADALEIATSAQCKGRLSHVVVSDENVFGDYREGYPRLQIALRQFSRNQHQPWQVIVFLREPLSWFSSLYQQALQEGSAVGPHEFWQVVQRYKHLDPLTVFQVLQREVGDKRLRVGIVSSRRNAVADFFDLCGLERPANVLIRENTSVTPTQGVLLRLLNSDPDSNKDDRNSYRQFLQRTQAHVSSETFSPFPESVQREIVTQHGPNWDQLGSIISSNPMLTNNLHLSQSDFGQPSPKPFVGSGIESQAVAEELLNQLRILILQNVPRDPGIMRRLGDKVATSPGDLIPAFRRRIHDFFQQRGDA